MCSNQDLTAFFKNIALLKVTDDPTPPIPIVSFLWVHVTPPLDCRILSFFTHFLSFAILNGMKANSKVFGLSNLKSNYE